MIHKIIDLSSTFEPTGEPTVLTLEKRAAELGEKEDHLKELFHVENPDPRYTYLHIIAMGAGEYYGPNTNGDYFPEKELIGACQRTNEGVKCTGYTTFEKNAKVYVEHQARPGLDVGDVLRAHYNQKMHRVELLIALDKEKAAPYINQIEQGKPLKFSMGCDVAYDECSICGNRAYKSRAEYCKHGKYELKKIYPDGRQVVRINYQPVFKDISIVRKPADETAYMLRKVASELQPQVSGLSFEQALPIIRKAADRYGLPLLLLAAFIYGVHIARQKFAQGYTLLGDKVQDKEVYLPFNKFILKSDGTLET